MAAKNNTSETQSEPIVPEGFAALTGGSCSFDGVEYAPDANGIVIVPVAAVASLIEHGFTYA